MMHNNLLKLENKFVIIIGGNGYIGKELAKDYDNLGAKVLVLDKQIPKNKNIKNILYQKFDLNKIQDFKRIFEKIVKIYGCPDIVINSAYPRTKSWAKVNFQKLKLKDLNENLSLQLTSFIWSSIKMAEIMKKNKKKGNIIIINSIYGKVAQHKNLYKGTNQKINPIYSAAKGGLITFVKSLASEYGEHGIRANSVVCGGLSGISASTGKKLLKLFIKNYADKTLVKRLGVPKDISFPIIFLSSPLSSYITGTELNIDGGYTSI